MYRGKRLRAKAGFGYQPKRLRKPGKYLMKSPRQTGGGTLLRCTAAAAALCTLTFAGAAGLSTAYLHDQDSVNNAFILGSVNPSVTETFSGTVKENVRIQNGSSDSDVPVYIRALVLISWKDADGHSIPAGEPREGSADGYAYTGPESGWVPGGDGYYYYTKPVPPGEATDVLIRNLEDIHTDSTRKLCVDVIAQAVQASPAQAVEEVFRGVSIGADGTTLIPPPAPGGGA